MKVIFQFVGNVILIKLYNYFIIILYNMGLMNHIGGKVLSNKTLTSKDFFAFLIGITIRILITLFLGKWLWNNILIELVPGIKPIVNIWQFLGITFLISLLTGL